MGHIRDFLEAGTLIAKMRKNHEIIIGNSKTWYSWTTSGSKKKLKRKCKFLKTNEIKDIRIEKEEVKLSLATDDMILNIWKILKTH